MESWKNIAKTRYVNDKQITDHYAIIPTGQGLNALGSVSLTAQRVYETIVTEVFMYFLSSGCLSESEPCDETGRGIILFLF